MVDQQQLKQIAHHAVASFLLCTGGVALVSPTTFANGFVMPVEADSFAAGYIQCIGGRNFTLGIIASIFIQRGDIRALSTIATLLALDGFIDGLVTLKYAEAPYIAAAPHFIAAAIIPFLSAWMSS